MESGFSPIDHHARYGHHDNVMNASRTSRIGDRQTSLHWLEPLELFKLDNIVYNDRLSSEPEVQGPSVFAISDPGHTMDLLAVDTDTCGGLSQHGLSNPVGFDTTEYAVQTALESPALTDELFTACRPASTTRSLRAICITRAAGAADPGNRPKCEAHVEAW